MTDPNDPIVPHPYTPTCHLDKPGLTKREYFAALALQGILAHPKEWEGAPLEPVLAGMAVLVADALIEKLNKEKKQCSHSTTTRRLKPNTLSA